MARTGSGDLRDFQILDAVRPTCADRRQGIRTHRGGGAEIACVRATPSSATRILDGRTPLIAEPLWRNWSIAYYLADRQSRRSTPTPLKTTLADVWYRPGPTLLALHERSRQEPLDGRDRPGPLRCILGQHRPAQRRRCVVGAGELRVSGLVCPRLAVATRIGRLPTPGTNRYARTGRGPASRAVPTQRAGSGVGARTRIFCSPTRGLQHG